MKKIVLCLNLFFLFSCGGKKTISEPYEIPNAEYKIHCTKQENCVSCFIPSEEEVKAMEAKIRSSLLNTRDNYLEEEKAKGDTLDEYYRSVIEDRNSVFKNLDHYNRRYHGVNGANNQRIIFLSAFDEAYCERNGDGWKNADYSVDGGGTMFWTIEYNVEEDSLYNFRINAPI